MAPLACVDIGGTKVAVSVADGQGVRGKVVEPTATVGDRGALAAQIISLVGQSCANAGVAMVDIAAVGVASCGPFVMASGSGAGPQLLQGPAVTITLHQCVGCGV